MSKKQQFAFSAINFYLLAAAIVTILIGFILMSGKGSTDTHFDPTIFDSRRTVVAPIICFLGYLFMIVAILYRPKSKNNEETGQSPLTSAVEEAQVAAEKSDLGAATSATPNATSEV